MKNQAVRFKIEKKGKQQENAWLPILQWLRLLMLSLSRIRNLFCKEFITEPEKGNIRTSINKSYSMYGQVKNTKTSIMKLQSKFLKWGFMLLLLISATNTIAQGPYPNTGNHSVCLNATEPYGVVLNAGSAYAWTITPLAGGNGIMTIGATPNLITINWNTLGTATLQVVETNSFGCVGDVVTIIVTVIPKPTLIVTNPASVCAPATVNLTLPAVTAGSTPGATFTYWTDAAATIPYPTATAATNGTYYIKATSAAGCFDIKPVVVTTSPAPNVVVTNPAGVCAPATVNITLPAVTAGSTAGLTYTYWTDAAASIPYLTATAATTGTYYIKGTNAGGCFDIKPVVVTANAAPGLVINNPAAVCSPATVDITATSVTTGSSAGLTFTYWTNAAATIPYPTPTTATAGTYYIKGTLAAGCFAIQPVVVTVNPLPTPLVSGPSPVCETVNGSTAVYTTTNIAGHSYNWVVAGGTITAGQGTNSITVSWTTPGPGSVSVTEAITALGCSAVNTKTIVINPKPVTTPITHN